MTQTRCDMARWPIVHVTMGSRFDQAQVDVVVAGLREALARKEAFVTVTDMSAVDPGAKYSQDAYKDFIDKNRDDLRRFCRGGALVVTSAALRIIINTFMLVVKLPFPTRAFNSQEEAIAWCSVLLKSGKMAS